MSGHSRRRPPTTPDPPSTRLQPEPAPDDAAGALRRVLGRLVDKQAETPPVDTYRRLRWAFWIGTGLALVVVLAMGGLGLYVLSIGSQFSDEAVAARTVSAANEVRGRPGQSCDPGAASSYTLECANRERIAAGLEPVEAPEGLSAAQIGGVMGEARADLRRVLRERTEGTTPSSGVNSPPTTGRFRVPR